MITHISNTSADNELTPDEKYARFLRREQLRKELKRRTDRNKTLPSQQLQANLDDYLARVRYGLLSPTEPIRAGYNISGDAARHVRVAANWVLGDPETVKVTTLFAKKTMPRRSLAVMAGAIGYRYMRGLPAIEQGLSGAALKDFKREREAFMSEWCAIADYAHGQNDKGQRPDLAVEAVQRFVQELNDLVPWFDRAGLSHEARALRIGLEDIGQEFADFVDRRERKAREKVMRARACKGYCLLQLYV